MIDTFTIVVVVVWDELVVKLGVGQEGLHIGGKVYNQLATNREHRSSEGLQVAPHRPLLSNADHLEDAWGKFKVWVPDDAQVEVPYGEDDSLEMFHSEMD
jgi:hypothetical protein